MEIVRKMENRCYILVGEKQNWEVGLENQVWGFKKSAIGSWNTTQPKEFVAFYVTKPIQKIIGFGVVKEKFVDEKFLWNDEKLFRRSLWPYKLSIEPFYVCKNWERGISLPHDYFLQVSRRVVPKDFFFDLVKNADSKWRTKIFAKMNNGKTKISIKN